MAKSIYKILIVEDEKIMQEVLVDKLSADPMFQVFTAGNGQEGLDSALKNTPDLILLDIMMPVMDGLAMMQELQKHEQTKNIHVILLTNYDTNEDILQKISEIKPCFYIVKSNIDLSDVAVKIKECLDIK